ncbi:unnamed protein product [Caenorhabditis auriculariae]|uniref:Vesicle transport protein n=1 Tax=Caenorhabditis auriculariae TaxID=2777116 RepID=A0A8S1HJE9_9PELO|nr:unnamed protein product [Caenorhabditis auriculariae]
MTSLEQFVSDQKKKNAAASSSSFTSLDSWKQKFSSSISQLPMMSRSDTAEAQLLGSELDGSDSQLPASKNRKNTGGWFSSGDENFFGLTRTQRIFAFFMCLIGAIFCFSTAAFLIPLIIVSTRKFAALNTLGSALLILSFAFLWGPAAYLQHMISPQRRLVTVCYMSALFATLYSSLWV